VKKVKRRVLYWLIVEIWAIQPKHENEYVPVYHLERDTGWEIQMKCRQEGMLRIQEKTAIKYTILSNAHCA